MQINVAYQNFKENLVSLINNSGLPMFMISECLEIVKARTDEVAARQLQDARRQDTEQEAKETLQNDAVEAVV